MLSIYLVLSIILLMIHFLEGFAHQPVPPPSVRTSCRIRLFRAQTSPNPVKSVHMCKMDRKYEEHTKSIKTWWFLHLGGFYILFPRRDTQAYLFDTPELFLWAYPNLTMFLYFWILPGYFGRESRIPGVLRASATIGHRKK